MSGEHGIGMDKKVFLLYNELLLGKKRLKTNKVRVWQKYLEVEYGGIMIGIMKEVKKVFDPRGILNPGKIFD